MTNPESKTRLPRRHFFGRFLAGISALFVTSRAGSVEASPQEENPYIGEIILASWGFPPRGWARCDGQVLAINQNMALFSLIGTTYGGNGVTTFALPDLRARVALHQGQGPGLTSRSLGERAGESSHVLLATEMPSHAHTVRGSSVAGTTDTPASLVVPSRNNAGIPTWAASPSVAMSSSAVSSVGNSQAHSNMQPYLGLNYFIALTGVFPN